jgi:HK97 family phage prohead protease
METDLATLNEGLQDRALTATIEVAAEGRTLSGYAVRWNEWTNIGGVYMERFAPGSWGDSTPKVIHEHGMDPSFGLKPVASLRSLVDDGTGAQYEAELLDAPYVEPLMPGLRAGLYGASFRFRALEQQVNKRPGKSDFNPDGIPEITVTQAKVVEISTTTFPAYPGSTASVRSTDITSQTEETSNPPSVKPLAINHRHKDWFI